MHTHTHTHTHPAHPALPLGRKLVAAFQQLSTGTTLQIAFDSAAASAGFDSCEADNWFNCEEKTNEQANHALALWPL